MSAKSKEATLLGFAAIITIASNGYFQEKDLLALFLRIASGQQIFFLFFQCLGQYQLLSFTRRFFGENIERARFRQHMSRKRINNHKRRWNATAKSPSRVTDERSDLIGRETSDRKADSAVNRGRMIRAS